MISKKKELLVECRNIFSDETDYYKRNWHDYYPCLITLVPEKSHLLDIGCGRGGLSEYLRDQKDCKVVGLEISSDAVRICNEKGIDAIESDIEVNEVSGKYDVILLAAVLEHLLDPVHALTKLRKNLKDDGSLIIGVPNFSHFTARIRYLLGKNVKRYGDDQTDMRLGIQPYGHIQFFNKKVLEHLLEKCGYRPVEWSYHRPQKYVLNWEKCFIKLVIPFLLNRLYQLDRNLFSVFISVKARKEPLGSNLDL